MKKFRGRKTSTDAPAALNTLSGLGKLQDPSGRSLVLRHSLVLWGHWTVWISQIWVTQGMSLPHSCHQNLGVRSSGYAHSTQWTRAVVLLTMLSHDQPGCFSVRGFGPCQFSCGRQEISRAQCSQGLGIRLSEPSALLLQEEFNTGVQARFLASKALALSSLPTHQGNWKNYKQTTN